MEAKLLIKVAHTIWQPTRRQDALKCTYIHYGRRGTVKHVTPWRRRCTYIALVFYRACYYLLKDRRLETPPIPPPIRLPPVN